MPQHSIGNLSSNNIASTDASGMISAITPLSISLSNNLSYASTFSDQHFSNNQLRQLVANALEKSQEDEKSTFNRKLDLIIEDVAQTKLKLE